MHLASYFVISLSTKYFGCLVSWSVGCFASCSGALLVCYFTDWVVVLLIRELII